VILDLNAKRAERAKNRGDGMKMVLADEMFDLVDELPIEIGELANDNKLSDALKVMLRDPDGDWDRLRKCRPSFNDVLDVVAFYGSQLGESVGSIESSVNTGQHLRSISSGTTDETSGATVTALQPAMPAESLPSSSISLPTQPSDAS
jgi:hypothetical protein